MMSRSSRIPVTVILAFLLTVLTIGPFQAHGHEQPPQIVGDLKITYFSDPLDPIAGSQATLFIQVENITSGVQLKVYHFLVEMIPPTGPRIIQHPLSDSMLFTFNQPGNWLLLFEIGVTDIAKFDLTATFIADVSQSQTSGLLAAFTATLVTAIPRSYMRWGHIVAVVLWLGTMLHVANTYRINRNETGGIARFAKIFRASDLVVAAAIGLLILTGVLRAFNHGLTTPQSLFQSDFGLVLLSKIALASGMIAVGLFNRVYLLPRVETETMKTGSDNAKLSRATLARRMYYLVFLEMGLGVVAILLGTVFTQIHTIT